jgi:putative endonuclease
LGSRVDQFFVLAIAQDFLFKKIVPAESFLRHSHAKGGCSLEIWGREQTMTVSKRNWVYMVRCRTGELYTGFTTDPGRRLREHNSGKASRFTRTRRPVAMVYLEECASRSAALRRELSVKGLSRERKLELCRRYAESRKNQ